MAPGQTKLLLMKISVNMSSRQLAQIIPRTLMMFIDECPRFTGLLRRIVYIVSAACGVKKS